MKNSIRFSLIYVGVLAALFAVYFTAQVFENEIKKKQDYIIVRITKDEKLIRVNAKLEDKDYKKDVFAAFRSCSWTWATWKDRWDGVDWELKDMKDFYNSPKLIRRLNSNGSDRFMRLYRQTKGNGSSWSVRFGAHLVKNNLLTVYPRYSYNSNIGCDESGVHSKSDDNEKMRVDLSKAIENPVLTDVDIDSRIQKIMKKHYSYGFVSEVKKFIATVLIVIKERLR